MSTPPTRPPTRPSDVFVPVTVTGTIISAVEDGSVELEDDAGVRWRLLGEVDHLGVGVRVRASGTPRPSRDRADHSPTDGAPLAVRSIEVLPGA